MGVCEKCGIGFHEPPEQVFAKYPQQVGNRDAATAGKRDNKGDYFLVRISANGRVGASRCGRGIVENVIDHIEGKSILDHLKEFSENSAFHTAP